MRPPSSVRIDDTLWRAERTMARRRLRHLPVLDAGQLVGAVSERDVLVERARLRATTRDHDWWFASVRAVMHEAPPTATPDDPPNFASDRLAESPEAILAVVERGFLVGIVTATDLLDSELRSWASDAVVTAADVMTEAPVTITPRDSLLEAARMMSDHQIRYLPVVEHGAVVGLLCDHNLLLKENPRRWSVRDVMCCPIAPVEQGTTLADLSRVLIDARLGAVPVVDDEQRLVGVVAYVDVLRTLANQFD
ncbi:MAG: CBS domain-containing protein [Deltaproteobacteria bacterium]|nr:CBS domain-containing protein [Deltaproteobacteria bacterium]MCW5803604.1 CBS domain-containing protein [Deltaproteobacteria bacterium]